MVDPKMFPQSSQQSRLPLEESPLTALLQKAYVPPSEREPAPAKVEVAPAPAPAPAKVELPTPSPAPEPYIEIRGDTYPIKEQLKAMGGTWNAMKRVWSVPKSREKEALELLLARVTQKQAELARRRKASVSSRAIEYYRQREAEAQARRRAALESRAPERERERAPSLPEDKVEYIENPNAQVGRYVEISICAVCGELKCTHSRRRIIRVKV